MGENRLPPRCEVGAEHLSTARAGSLLATVLIVEDDPINAGTLTAALSISHNVMQAATLAEAERVLTKQRIDLVLLDILLPDGDGADLCGMLKNNVRTSGIPVILMSSLESTVDKVRGFHAGAVDYLCKPVVREEVLIRVRTHLDLHFTRRSLQQSLIERASLLDLRTAELLAMRKSAELIRKLATTVEQSPCSVMITDIRGTIEYVNSEFSRSSGYADHEVMGENPRILKSGYMSQLRYDELWSAILSGRTWRGELHNKRKNGSYFWERAIITPVSANDGAISHFVAIKEDITEQRRRDLELAEAKLRAESADFAKAQFMAMISHELHTPLNAVIGFAELIENHTIDGSCGDNCARMNQHQSFSRIILDSGRSLISSLDSIMECAAMASLAATDTLFPAAEAYRAAARQAEAKAEQFCVHFAADPACESTLIRGDEKAIRNALCRILNNAIKFTPRDGSVSLSMLRDGNGGMTFTVKDTGIGIDANDLRRIMEPFAQADPALTRRQGGLGLGLPLAQRVAESHGGRLEIRSQLGVGTVVKIVLPPERIE